MLEREREKHAHTVCVCVFFASGYFLYECEHIQHFEDDASSIQTVIYCVYVTMCRHKANRKSSNNKTANIRYKHTNIYWINELKEPNEWKKRNKRKNKIKIKPKTLNRFCMYMCSIKLYFINKIQRRGRDLLNIYRIDCESLQYPVKVNFLILSYFSF